jgi:hypothetical protein
MATRRLKRPRDPIQLGKLIVEIATGQVADEVETKPTTRGQQGGLRGGQARKDRLDPSERRKIAQNAAAARWSGKGKRERSD